MSDNKRVVADLIGEPYFATNGPGLFRRPNHVVKDWKRVFTFGFKTFAHAQEVAEVLNRLHKQRKDHP